MNVFVSGGSGFVGRNLIAALVARGDAVLALARSAAAAATVEALGARVVRGDLDEVAVLRNGMSGCQAVFHSAAVARRGEFRAFITAQARAHGVEPGARSVPRGLLYAVAALSELAWRTLPLRGGPPITRTALRLAGEEVTVNDAKARRELGYVGRVTLEEGLAEIAAERRVQGGSQ